MTVDCSLKMPPSGATRSRKNPAANPPHASRSPHVWRFVADNQRLDELADYGSTVRPMERRQGTGQNEHRYRFPQPNGVRPSMFIARTKNALNGAAGMLTFD